MTAPMQTIQPGVYHDMSNEDYHGGPGISKSGLDLIAKSPALFKYRYLDGNKHEQTRAMLIGSATHTAVLEPEKFDFEYVVSPCINRRTKAGKEEYLQFQNDNTGKNILNSDDYDQIRRIAESVRSHPVAAQIFTSGQAESSIFNVDEATGELVKVRPDYMGSDYHADLKTTDDASADAFSRACWNFRYFVQASLYLDVSNAVIPNRFRTFIFVCVEKKEPYQVAVYYADEDMVALGRDEYRRCLDLYHQYKKQANWPGYNLNMITPIALPGWANRQLESNNILTQPSF